MMAQGERNAVLNADRIGVMLFDQKNYLLSEQVFEDAITRIAAVYADNEHAETARSLWNKESVKDFKGEPYERAMTYYYRGLLHLLKNEYDLARATFREGVLQDAFAEEEQNRADFALLMMLETWAGGCRNGKAPTEADLAEIKKLDRPFTPPEPSDNVLVVVETGKGPVKFSQGDSGSSKPRYLKFSPGDSKPQPIPRLILPHSEKTKPSALTEDIFYQAVTRGGRPIDAIINGKVQFKEGVNIAGDVMLVAGAAVLDGNRNNKGAANVAGAALLLGGLIAKGISEAVEPDADIRYWDNLPGYVHLLTTTAKPGHKQVECVPAPPSSSAVTIS
ncbi:hypothetical protein CCP2SC5_2780001 [Azospirillaceae bacterium]